MALYSRLLLQSAVGLLVVLISLFAPDFTYNSRYYLLALVILLVGMPHGAIDHIISEKMDQWQGDLRKKVWFYSWYLGLVGMYSLMWVWYPLFSFAFFMVITWYHFGQADAERFELSGWKKHLIHFSRGFTVVGLIAYGDLAYSSAVIESITGFSLLDFTIQRINPEWITWGIAAFYPIVFLGIASFHSFGWKHVIVFFLDAVSVSVLFMFADPVWAFSIYFGLWHSFNHVRVMLSYLSDETTRLNFGWFYRESFIYSLLSYLGILLVYNMTNAFGQEKYLVSLLFAAISVLTLPHMYVVQKLYTTYRK